VCSPGGAEGRSLPPEPAADYVELAGALLNRPAAPVVPAPRSPERAISSSGINDTRAHSSDLQDQIAKILDPKFAAAQPASASGPVRRTIEACWPEYE
jgi:hypothetical protein